MAEIANFHQCIEQCDLIELPTSGSRYTWNDRHGDSRILSKIDWVFINSDWLISMPNFNAQYLEEGISDHCPLKILPINVHRRAKSIAMYGPHPNFLDVVKEGWNQAVQGCSMFRVVKKLKLLKHKLRDLNRRHFNNIVATADPDKLALARAQAELHNNPLDTRLQTDQEDIAAIFVDYYQELLGTKGRNRPQAFHSFLRNVKTLSTTQQMQLVRPYSVAEVKTAMFSIEETKSPGPDGYGSDFYKASWSIIRDEVTSVVLKFFENEQLLTQINSTIIALIPKVDNPLLAGQLRPISYAAMSFTSAFLR
ncbi:uncharacterized protein LOC107783620 [Nicotiana tabacum]|uniref:Uncharacterized protein LOC107783620 n=1 Tax=Nicotiana tabacum TaxID=4097 RepID=A0A1S3Z6R1_TOBAC|nr:PREDICTED: uncharacterized protein LOC107783620 [Nicotiana tabacum]